jgi:hypothetical protein
MVADPSGAVVPRAEVTATQTTTGLVLKTVTSGEGTYVFPSLAPSFYNVSVTRSGFESYTENGLQVRADAALTVNVTLKTGSTTVTVSVSAEAAQVDTTTGTLEQVIGTSQVSDLPLEGRNAAALTEEVAGITIAPTAQADQGNTKTFPVVYTISANGTFVGQTNYMLDGGNNVDEYTNVNMPFPIRCVAGVQYRDQQLQRAIRPECRRCGQYHHQEREQQISRRPVRVRPQWRPGCSPLVQL